MQRILFLFLCAFFLWPASGMAWITRIFITGSTTVKPIVERIAEAYSSARPGIEFEITSGGSGNGIKAIIDNTTDFGSSSRFIKMKELEYALAKGTYPVPFQIAYDGIIPIVHPHNTLKNLTADQLRNIYAGLITNWKELGGSDLPISVVSRDNSSGTYDLWVERVMAGVAIIPAAKLVNSDQDVVNTVATDLSTIGYIGLGFLNNSVKSISIDNIEGSVETVRNGRYPLTRPLFMFTRGWPTDELLNFIHYVLDPAYGQKWVAETGFVPLYQGAKP